MPLKPGQSPKFPKADRTIVVAPHASGRRLLLLFAKVGAKKGTPVAATVVTRWN